MGEPKQAGLLEGGLVVALEAWLRWFTVHPQGSGLPFLTHTLPRGPVFTFPGLCPTQALAREEQAESGQPPQDLGGLPGANGAIYTSGHSPTEQYIFKQFLPK